MVPAAVVSIGKILGRVSAAIKTALYPQMVPMDESASMLCARVVRGTSSTEKEVTPVSAICCTTSTDPNGRKNPISACPRRIDGRSAFPVKVLEPQQRN